MYLSVFIALFLIKIKKKPIIKEDKSLIIGFYGFTK
jgi:hypothetical protein